MRAFVVCCIIMPPMYAILWNSRNIMTVVIPHADPEMLRLAAVYVKITSLGIPVRSLCLLGKAVTARNKTNVSAR